MLNAEVITRYTDFTIPTAGNGYWSDKIADVRFIRMDVIKYQPTDPEDPNWGELRLYFDPESWNIETDGLIYGDYGFVEKFKEYIASIGVMNRLSYSEQGMQGDDFVSFDVHPDFIESFERKSLI